MSHGRRKHPLIRHINKYLPIAAAFLGLGILLTVILPIWVWVLTASIILIILGISSFCK